MAEEYPEPVREFLRASSKTNEEKHSYEALEGLRKGLGEKVHIDDAFLIEDLISLGFSRDTVAALPLVPLIQIAWADGQIQKEEAKLLKKLARERGIELGEDQAWTYLEGLITTRPKAEYLDACLYVLRTIYDKLPDDRATSTAKDNMFGFAKAVAEASGGFLGIFGNKVTGEEEEALLLMKKIMG